MRAFGTKVGKTNLPAEVPIIGLGCSSFSTFFLKDSDDDGDNGSLQRKLLECCQANAHLLPVDHKMVQEWIATIIYAVENGINLLDTAPWYGHGSSEVVIGYALKKLLRMEEEDTSKSADDVSTIERKDIIINTKVGRYDADPEDQFDFSYDATMKSVKRSIERMNCGFIDVLQLHDPEFSPSIELLLEETLPALAECKRLGYARAIGITGYPLEIQIEILQRADKGLFDQSLTYGHFNLHNQNLFTKPMVVKTTKDNEHSKQNNNECTSMSFVEYCQSESIAIMAAAPLSMGLLTHTEPPVWHPASDELKQACKDAANIAKENDVNLPTLAVLFAICHNGIGGTLLGMGNRKEIDAALEIIERFKSAMHNTVTDSCTCSISGSLGDGAGLRKDISSRLANVLRDNELLVLNTLLEESGPFQKFWKAGCGYDWDGMKEADLFWSSIQGGKKGAEARMRNRFKE